ncbi:MAG: VOC family protein [Anaerolineae bacterium]|nr:VOC family protein [Anaerolineae bacterium]
MKRVTGIGGIFFKVNDPQAMADWYSKHLGLDLEDQSPTTTFRWREKDDPQVGGATVWALFPQETEYFGSPGNTFMINYRVDDLDALVATLRQEGVTIHGEIQATEHGRFIWITDPEGNRIELWQAPDDY